MHHFFQDLDLQVWCMEDDPVVLVENITPKGETQSLCVFPRGAQFSREQRIWAAQLFAESPRMYELLRSLHDVMTLCGQVDQARTTHWHQEIKKILTRILGTVPEVEAY